ncbi:hypothetical protein M0Q50_09735 [bacterium]|jgi:hypothetical protein|nr:hypothetical protein [bacterium]
MDILTDNQQSKTEQSIYLEDKDRIVSASSDMDEHDIGHQIRVNEYGVEPEKSAGEYFISASKNPENVLGKLKNSILTKVGLHPDKEAIGARAVMALNEINRVKASGLPDEEQGKEMSAIHEDLDKYLSGKGIYTRSAQNLAMNDFMLNIGMAAIGAGAIEKFGALAFTKGLLKFTATNTALKYGVFPAIKATSIPEGQAYEYKPLALSELLGIKTEQAGLKTGADILEMGLTGGIMLTPKMIQQAKITAVVKEALPRLTELFNEKNIKIPETGLTTEYVLQMARQSPELGTAIDLASQEMPFYKALGRRGSILLPEGGEPLKKPEIKPIEPQGKAIEPKEAKIPFKYKTRGFISSIQEEIPGLRVAGQYVPRTTDRLAMKAKTLIKEDLSMAEKMAKSGTDDSAIATGAELLKYYSEQAELSTEEIAKNAYYEKASDLGNDMAKRLTDLGRSVQAASILSRLTPEGQLRFAARTIQKYNEEVIKSEGGFLGLKKSIPELTPEQTKDIIDSMKEIETMPEGEEKAIRFRDLQNYISDLVPTPLYNKIVAVWKAGLLTGLKTTGVNVLSNFSHAFGTEVIKDIPAVAVDSIASLFTKKRTVAFTTKGIKGIKEGLIKGWRFLKTGYDERNVLTKYDYRRVNFGKSKFAKGLQKYEETVFSILGAEDQPFYYGAKARSLYEQAKVQAINKGLKGEEADSFINELVDKPTDEMITYAVADAEVAVFQNKTALSEAAGQLKKISGLEFILPFSKTPSAVAMQILNYSPLGAIKTIFQNAGKGKFNQRDFSKAFGRAILGTGVLALGAYMFRKGMITLDRPTSESERKLWDLEGRKPNAIKIGDKYRSTQVLGPAGNILLIGAQFQNAFDKSGSPTEAISKGLSGSAKSFTEQTYLTGISSALEGLTQPDRSAEQFVGGLISSVVPTLVKDIAQVTDPKARRAENITQRLIERVPILRQSLEPQVDILGREKLRKENFLEVLIDPTRPSTEIKEPIAQEIRRLVDLGEKVNTSQLGDRKGYKILSQEQNTQLWQRSGQIAYDKLSALMNISAYDTVSDDIKTKKINEIFDNAKLVARAEKVVEITTDLQGEELKNKLSEAKKEGLLNREVYNLYMRIR